MRLIWSVESSCRLTDPKDLLMVLRSSILSSARNDRKRGESRPSSSHRSWGQVLGSGLQVAKVLGSGLQVAKVNPEGTFLIFQLLKTPCAPNTQEISPTLSSSLSIRSDANTPNTVSASVKTGDPNTQGRCKGEGIWRNETPCKGNNPLPVHEKP